MHPDVLVRLVGWHATILHGDPLVPVRWLWLRRHLPAGAYRTLDAGCGSGAFTLYAAKIGNEAVGISFNSREIDKAARRAQLLGLSTARFLEGDLRRLRETGNDLGTFDHILCCETVEHISDDRKLLADLAALLKPGGRLLLTTRFKQLRMMPGDRISDVEDGNEVRWGYTLPEMEALCRAAGLEVSRSEYLAAGVVTYALTFTLRVVSTVNARLAWLVTFPLRALQVLDRPLTWLMRFPFMSIAIVAVKPER
jgi:SAM-dependent methyltransferase